MRVLWTSNILLPDLRETMGLPRESSGSWMSALAKELAARHPEIVVGVVSMHPTAAPGKRVIRNVAYYTLPCRKGESARWPKQRTRRRFAEVVADFRPDLIHVNGSELNYGLMASEAAPGVPAVLSIQGLVGRCAEVYWGGIGLWDLLRFRTLRDWLRLDGLIERRWKWRRRARIEAEILRRARHVVGRTLWDRAYTRVANFQAVYHTGQELLRREFFDAAWSLDHARRGTIFACAAGYPLKGLHVLLQAVALLKRDFPGVRLRVPGVKLRPGSCWERVRCDGYWKYLVHLIGAMGLEEHVESLGVLDARAMAQELAAAHLFVAPSFVENLSNSLAEAMLVGTPCVASYAGGMVTTVHDRVEALACPAGDAAMLAERIRSLFQDDGLTRTLSENARRTARARHDPQQVTEQIVSIYRAVVEDPVIARA
jgi:glycosyltransferase involved in cell wall biosynthesis